jgi:hypothetical protein
MEAESIDFLAKQIKLRVHKDFDLVTAITGEEGSGMSRSTIFMAPKILLCHRTCRSL